MGHKINWKDFLAE